MISFLTLYEDSQHAGYKETLETPRPLGNPDYIFVGVNVGRDVGQLILDVDGKEVKGTVILQNDKKVFQYAHRENKNEVHIESVEMYRDLWNSIHVPTAGAALISKL